MILVEDYSSEVVVEGRIIEVQEVVEMKTVEILEGKLDLKVFYL
jgi:hypothetical protein